MAVAGLQSGGREAVLGERCAVKRLAVAVGRNCNRLAGHRKRAVHRLHTVVCGGLAARQRVFERVLHAANIGDAREITVGRLLAAQPATAGDGDCLTRQLAAVVGLGIRAARQGDIAAGDRQGILALRCGVVAVLGLRLHCQRALANVGDARNRGSPSGATVRAVANRCALRD